MQRCHVKVIPFAKTQVIGTLHRNKHQCKLTPAVLGTPTASPSAPEGMCGPLSAVAFISLHYARISDAGLNVKLNADLMCPPQPGRIGCRAGLQVQDDT